VAADPEQLLAVHPKIAPSASGRLHRCTLLHANKPSSL